MTKEQIEHLLIAGAVVLTMGLFYLILQPLTKQPTNDLYIKGLEQRLDSLGISYDVMEDSLLEQRKTSDSLKLTIEVLTKEKQQIKAKYEKIRRDINNMSIDEHIEFISTAISKEDSIAR